jgi:hypothetical protein
LFVFAALLYFFYQAGAMDNMTVGSSHGRPASPTEILLAKLWAGAFGLTCVTAGIRMTIGFLNEKIVIDQGEITWTDWLGRTKLRAHLANTKAVLDFNTMSGQQQRKKVVADTDGGQLVFNGQIDQFAVLRDLLLTHGGSEAQSAKASQEVLRVGQLLPARTFGYRYCPTHLISFFLIALILLFGAGPYLAANFNNPPTPPLDASFLILWYLFLSLFMGLAVWMQLQGWNEKIKIGPDGVEWIDCMGRTRLKAGLDEIQHFEETTMSSNSGQRVTNGKIYTSKGIIQVSSYLRDYQDLAIEINRFVTLRNQMSDPT